MKNIFRTISAVTLFVAVAGCDLTLYPEDAVSPEVYFKNESDFEQWTNYLYVGLLDDANTVSRYNADDMVDKSMGSMAILSPNAPEIRKVFFIVLTSGYDTPSAGTTPGRQQEFLTVNNGESAKVIVPSIRLVNHNKKRSINCLPGV